VESPDRLTEDPVEAIIITALVYRDEIMTQLRKDIGFKGQVAFLGPHLQIVDKE
jgi:hypothetical protein